MRRRKGDGFSKPKSNSKPKSSCIHHQIMSFCMKLKSTVLLGLQIQGKFEKKKFWSWSYRLGRWGRGDPISEPENSKEQICKEANPNWEMDNRFRFYLCFFFFFPFCLIHLFIIISLLLWQSLRSKSKVCLKSIIIRCGLNTRFWLFPNGGSNVAISFCLAKV